MSPLGWTTKSLWFAKIESDLAENATFQGVRKIRILRWRRIIQVDSVIPI
jgi:hypothetical protein